MALPVRRVIDVSRVVIRWASAAKPALIGAYCAFRKAISNVWLLDGAFDCADAMFWAAPLPSVRARERRRI
jgi:hypothetical protein